ncbi:hypothetical protein GCM10027155_19270 [Acinetobacter apis]|uniref:Uncharacterized protein n=1 Tax=Acinetobacter apis TaxID=1229165 RepID=A0A217EIN4_9GAMM|nr:hypothetical protein [Acinetobacter apis]SNQ30252.1 hypothetical protein SAMN05444584_2241 [Acinetobacter apis]
MTIDDELSEREIAIAAARTLQEKFIEVAKTEAVLYVENDVLFRREPGQKPVFVKHLVGRDPYLTKLMLNQSVFIIKKRSIE